MAKDGAVTTVSPRRSLGWRRALAQAITEWRPFAQLGLTVVLW